MKKFLEAIDGHKAVIGLIILNADPILQSLSAFAGALIPLFSGLQLTGAVLVSTKLVGAITTVIGGVHKIAKIYSDFVK